MGSSFGWQLERAISPDDVRRALLKEQPVLAALGALPGDVAQARREEAAAGGELEASPADLAFRKLFPALDIGVYVASHAVGKPSLALQPALAEHHNLLRTWGFEAWNEGWSDVLERFAVRVADLVGGDLLRGAVLRFANVSDALSALLNSGLRGRLVSHADHFTGPLYIHEAWAARTHSELVTVPADPSGRAPLSGLIDALSSNTEVVSVSTAGWRTGVLLDLYGLAEAIMDICPDAALLVDAYQTLGTVPLSIGRLPLRTAVVGGGIKQLRSGPGAGFAWVSHPLLHELEPDRLGWWAHERPLEFEPPPLVPAAGAERFRTGFPDPAPLVGLCTELDVLATSGNGSLEAAIRRARDRTQSAIRSGVRAAVERGLTVAGEVEIAERAAFFSIEVPHREVVRRMHDDGIVADFRGHRPGSDAGLCRISANSASFPYEVVAAVQALAGHSRRA